MAGFEDRAAEWIRLARAEGHDAYRLCRDAFFDLTRDAVEYTAERPGPTS